MPTDSGGLGLAGYAYRGDELFCEDVAVADLAERYGTPLYVYSRAAIEGRFRALREAFGPSAHICYAVKANPNLSLLRLMAGWGAGFDLVSGGELARLAAAGVPSSGAVFAGVAKEAWEIRAAAEAKILFSIVESEFEVASLDAIAAEVGSMPVAVRINPDVEADTHDYIRTGAREDKFGLSVDQAAAVARRVQQSPHLDLVGYHMHIGSQLMTPDPYLAAFARFEAFLDSDPALAEGVRYFDLGGGFGISYSTRGGAMDVGRLAEALLPGLRRRELIPVLEPGRFLVADAGILVASVLGTKVAGTREFALVDAAMNDLIRPALYSAEHPVARVRGGNGPVHDYDIVGPVCESGDFLARGRPLAELASGDLLSVFCAGAYGSSMASNYNSRRRPAEVLVAGEDATVIRRRESLEDLWAAEVQS